MDLAYALDDLTKAHALDELTKVHCVIPFPLFDSTYRHTLLEIRKDLGFPNPTRWRRLSLRELAEDPHPPAGVLPREGASIGQTKC